MSDLNKLDDLKRLTWTVQTRLDEPGFDTLVTRARHRRLRRRTVLASATLTAAVAATALVTTDPLGARSLDPAATTSPSVNNPGPQTPPLRSAQEVIHGPSAAVIGVLVGPPGVAGMWGSCFGNGADCQTVPFTRNAAGRMVTGPVSRGFWLAGGDHRYGVVLDWSVPQATSFTAMIVSDTGQPVETLTRADDTTTVDGGEVLMRDDFGPVLVDPQRRTLRRLTFSGDLANAWFGQVARDATGGIWLIGGPEQADGWLLHSTDGGRSWSRTPLGVSEPRRASFAVSSDGRTVALAGDTRRPDPSGSRIRVSHDGGRTWSELPQRPFVSAMAAFDDGTVVLNTATDADPSAVRTAYRIDPDLQRHRITTAPARFSWLGSAGDTLFGYSGNRLLLSTDLGEHWTEESLR